MTESLTLAQQHLYTFQACRRRFYLRYLARVPWPEAPLGSQQEQAYERGRRFHRWIERQFLGLPPMEPSDNDPQLRQWWEIFQTQAPLLPDGHRFVETSLTVPVGRKGRHHLTGRFDLLIVSDEGDEPAAGLFDWKTGEPRPIERLRRAWQTRVYLYLLAEGGAALAPQKPDAFAPRRLTLTYWYVEEPQQPRVITYDDAAHRRNRIELEAIIAEIDDQLTTGEWPLTDDWTECRHCAYRAYCGRQAAGAGKLDPQEEEEPEPDDLWLEPQWG
ncbi:MAG: PD-(D/E)XK nuclease family protein [Candidatus Promineofilum sp.]|uniref:PD-(D/E)XK nuclease family protein n=1 Tax=Promineifilum sp. TaxID=2664178 RepID=UPI002411E9C5|nr:PD-(D/E)XK nuclease family protein [Promineifilum sp.]